MRRPDRTLWLLLALLGAGGCLGGLENDIFRGTAAVDGTLPTPFDRSRAWVAIDGNPRLLGVIEADGRFTIASVPAGAQRLVASNGLADAAEQDLLVLSERSNRVDLAWRLGAIVRGQLFLEDDDLARRADIGLVGLPLQDKSAVDDRFEFGALPAGCYTVWARHPLHEESRTDVCVDAGDSADVVLYLRSAPVTPTPDGGSVELRPLCAPCLSGSECASGVCATYRHPTADEQVCTQPCNEDTDCPIGFDCDELEYGGALACVPHEASCSAYANVGASCAGAGDCGVGEEDGSCVDQHCTLSCEETRDCPSGLSCQPLDDSESVCR